MRTHQIIVVGASSCMMRVVGQGVIGDLCEKNSGYCAGMDSF